MKNYILSRNSCDYNDYGKHVNRKISPDVSILKKPLGFYWGYLKISEIALLILDILLTIFIYYLETGVGIMS